MALRLWIPQSTAVRALPDRWRVLQVTVVAVSDTGHTTQVHSQHPHPGSYLRNAILMQCDLLLQLLTKRPCVQMKDKQLQQEDATRRDKEVVLQQLTDKLQMAEHDVQVYVEEEHGLAEAMDDIRSLRAQLATVQQAREHLMQEVRCMAQHRCEVSSCALIVSAQCGNKAQLGRAQRLIARSPVMYRRLVLLADAVPGLIPACSRRCNQLHACSTLCARASNFVVQQ
jgi:hypothetical protein